MEKGKTKIIATIGPATESGDMIRSLIAKGMDVARLNTKHNEPEWHLMMIKRIRKISKEMGVKTGILLDLQGPEIRIENFNKTTVDLAKDSVYKLVCHAPTNAKEFYIPYPNVIASLKKGGSLSANDGAVDFEIVGVNADYATIRALNNYSLGHRKTLNVPGLTADIPSITTRDINFLEIIKNEPVDFVGLSFVRNKKDILILKTYLQKLNSDAKIIAKIETKLALQNIEEIIKETDVLMIARGDLGIENPIEEIAYWQKKLIKLCREKYTPVIVATQMLKSMIDTSTPTRAEATDIANAVFDGTDAVMLSEETAIGAHAEKAIMAMAKIAHFNESKHELINSLFPIPKGPTEVFANAAAHLIENGSKFNLDKVLVFTETGFTAMAISAYRPKYEIHAITDNRLTAHSLSMVYGVRPQLIKFPRGKITFDNLPIQKLITLKILKKGDTVLIIHGTKWREPGTSNVLAFFKV